MPVCTTCTSYTPYLYTEYQSAYNLRLEQGTEPRRPAVEAKDEGGVDDQVRTSSRNRERARWLLVLKLGAALVFLDAFIRWSHINPNQPITQSPWTRETLYGIARVFIGCSAETVAFHSGIMIACYIFLRLIAWVQAWRYRGGSPPSSDIKREFRFSLVPLTLFYSSLTKLFLLFLLTIWRPTVAGTVPTTANGTWAGEFLFNNSVVDAFKVFNDDEIDREWVIRNVLGGMSAGFGLRVVLDIHPIFTSLIILVGWKAKTSVTVIVSSWIGDESVRQAWRAYSIP